MSLLLTHYARPHTKLLTLPIAEVDEFKGRWEALKILLPDRLNAMRKVATIESVGSSTRIEGVKLSDAEVEELLSQALSSTPFKSRDEQEVAGYAEAMDLVFEAFADMPLTENDIRQLHQTLLRHSVKDVPYASLERVIEENKELYYKALRRTQTSLKDDKPDWQPWAGFFLRCLKK